MNNGGDAAEQIVRLSLEGFEVAAKLSGSAAKNVAILLVAILKQEQKTKGKARLTSMIKSGKELKVFSIQNKDLKKFTEQAKRYGVLYCVLRDKNAKDESAAVDIIARAEDASKIQRIVERFELGKVDKASIISEVEKAVTKRDKVRQERPGKSKSEQLMEEAVAGDEGENPTMAKTDENLPSRPNLGQADMQSEKTVVGAEKKPSVREKLDHYKKEAGWQKEHSAMELQRRKAKYHKRNMQNVRRPSENKNRKMKVR